MAAPGTPFETPRACPFVALELDRDKRSDTPDYRHRCFAEPTPAPRSIAHQEAYCLSPNFSTCPVFQDWAVRAAARPVAGSGSSAALTSGAAIVGGAAPSVATDIDQDVADVEAETAPPADTSAINELPEDASVTPAGAEIAAAAAAVTGASPGVSSPPTFATTDWQSQAHESEQLGVFDAAASDPHSSYGQPDAGYQEPAPSPAFVPPPTPLSSQSVAPADAAAAAAVPAFLAGRTTRPQSTPASMAGGTLPPRPPAAVSRDDLVPSWDIDGRYGAESPRDSRGGGRLDGILTAIAVIAILALGVAAVLFLPGLLNKGAAPRTPGPSFVIPSTLPSFLPSALPTIAPTGLPTALPSVLSTAPPSVAPVGSPRLYKIKSGDSLQHIANKFGVTIQSILDANPEISDPNNIFVGQIIVIPPSPEPTPTA